MRTFATLLFGLLLTLTALGPVTAASSVRAGMAAIERQDFARAVVILSPLAQTGNPDAQAYMGYMYEIGRGEPQDYTQAALWYRRAAEQGQSWAQFQLARLYDEGHGVPVDPVEAEKWFILAVAASPPASVEERTRMRDAVLTKLTRGGLAEARMRALAWRPKRE
jgi:uncharacterized protein